MAKECKVFNVILFLLPQEREIEILLVNFTGFGYVKKGALGVNTMRKTNRELLLPYVLPYGVWVLIFSLLHDHLEMSWIYALRILLVAGLVWKFRRCYVSVFSAFSKRTSVLSGLLWGGVGAVVWVVLVSPFAPQEALPWDKLPFFLRAMSATLLVPVFEELLMRGYLFGVASQWGQFRSEKREDPLMFTLDHATINDIRAPSWSLAGVTVSTVFFTAGHLIHEWPAALAYSLLMAFVLVRTGGLLSCVIAHGTTNLSLALYVWFSGRWGLW